MNMLRLRFWSEAQNRSKNGQPPHSTAGVASILVPFPYAVDDHQTSNAKFLADSNAAILMPQNELTPQVLAELVMGLSRKSLMEMAINARALAKPDATRVVAGECMKMITR